MIRSSIWALPIVIACVVGCGEDEVVSGTPSPPRSGSAATSAAKPAKSATAQNSATASASASASTATPTTTIAVPVSTGPVKWGDFSGPDVTTDLLANSSAWVAMPVSQGWETLKFSLVSVNRVDGSQVIVRGANDQEVFVPAAFTTPAKPADNLATGDAVLVAARDSRAFARVVSVGGGKVKVRYRYAGDIEELEVAPNTVMKLDGTLRFGAPAAFAEVGEMTSGSVKTTWRPVFFVHAAEDKTWIVTSAGRPLRVASKQIKPLVVHPIHKPGDSVWVARGEEFKAGTISQVEDDGLRYKLKLENGEDTSATFETVSPPIK